MQSILSVVGMPTATVSFSNQFCISIPANLGHFRHRALYIDFIVALAHAHARLTVSSCLNLHLLAGIGDGRIS